MEKVARELELHMSHPGTDHWKALGRLIGYLKGKETKGIVILNPKFIKAVMCCDQNYATDKETRNNVSGLVATNGRKIPTCLSKTQSIVKLIITEAEYVALSECTQEVKFCKYVV